MTHVIRRLHTPAEDRAISIRAELAEACEHLETAGMLIGKALAEDAEDYGQQARWVHRELHDVLHRLEDAHPARVSWRTYDADGEYQQYVDDVVDAVRHGGGWPGPGELADEIADMWRGMAADTWEKYGYERIVQAAEEHAGHPDDAARKLREVFREDPSSSSGRAYLLWVWLVYLDGWAPKWFLMEKILRTMDEHWFRWLIKKFRASMPPGRFIPQAIPADGFSYRCIRQDDPAACYAAEYAEAQRDGMARHAQRHADHVSR